MSWYRPVLDLFIYIPTDFSSNGHIAGFDLDWTIIRPIRGSFPKDVMDLAILPNRRTVLQGIIDKGYTLVIFTNQKSTNDKKKTFNFTRINNFITMINLPMIVMMATTDDLYRKPLTGMWNVLGQMTTIKSGFYCGDAAGRPQDFSNSDKMFAQASGITFYLPEELFPSVERITPGNPETINKIELPPDKSLVIFVGMPGSGKTTFYETSLKPLGYVHISQDQLRTKVKVLSSINLSMNTNQLIAVDATNPGQDRRQEYYDLANRYTYTITVLYFVRDGKGWNKLRPSLGLKLVPTVAFSVYFKNLTEPSPSNTPGLLYYIS